MGIFKRESVFLPGKKRCGYQTVGNFVLSDNTIQNYLKGGMGMNYKGAWNEGTDYVIGDVVVFEDNVAYVAVKDPPAGTSPYDTLYFNRVGQPMQEMVTMFHGTLSGLTEAMDSIPTNINDEAIVLKGTEDAEYLITVDDSGETPELSVELIEEESGGD